MSGRGTRDLPGELWGVAGMDHCACAEALAALPGIAPPPRLPVPTLRSLLAYKTQVRAFGRLRPKEQRALRAIAEGRGPERVSAVAASPGSFAQFEREVTAERIRDKIAASKAKGLWMGGNVPLGYEAEDRTLRVVPAEAETVRTLFDFYETLGSVTAVTREAVKLGLRSKRRIGRDGSPRGGLLMGRGQIHHVLSNPVYAGRIRRKHQVHEG